MRCCFTTLVKKFYDIYDVEKRETEATFEATRAVLNDYFAPKKNVQMEIYNFRSCKQNDQQSLDEFVTELRTLAKNCELANVDNEILQQVIQNCKSNQLRRRVLRELSDILTMGRMLGQSHRQAAAMESSEHVQHVSQRQRGSANRHGRKPERGGQHYANSSMQRGRGLSVKPRDRAPPKVNTCRACGYEYPHKQTCPAKGKTARNRIISVGAVGRGNIMLWRFNYSPIQKRSTTIESELKV